MKMTSFYDHYSFRARLQPAFIALLPVALGAMAWALPGAKWITAIWSLLGAAGFTFFLANLARNRGKSIEPALWKAWDGSPAVRFLRHRGDSNSVLRERWHLKLEKLLGRRMPTQLEEENDPTAADAVYEAATRLLIGKTYDQKAYPFVFRDNVNYGFCRNLYGLRGLGLISSVVGLGVSLSAALSSHRAGHLEALSMGCSGVCFALLLWWIFTVKAAWVRVPAENYARHLFASLETVQDPKQSVKKGKQLTGGST